MYTHTYVYTYIYIHIYRYIYMYRYMYIYIYTDIYWGTAYALYCNNWIVFKHLLCTVLIWP